MKYFTSRIQTSTLFILISISLVLKTNSFAALLLWDANSEVDLAGYNLYYKTSSQNYSSVVDLGNVTAYNLNNLNLKEAETYSLALTSYDTTGNESDLSEELDYFSEDGIPEEVDNCPEINNPNQKDTYPPEGNGIGDACDCEGDFDCDGDVDGRDGMLFRVDFGRSLYDHPCNSFDPCRGDFDCDGDVDGRDGMLFEADFGRNSYAHPCPYCYMNDWCSYQ